MSAKAEGVRAHGARPAPGRPGRPCRQLVVSTVGTCFHTRVTGLAAEAAFFALLSLPPLLFALAGSIGYVFDSFSPTQVDDVRRSIIEVTLAGTDPADRRHGRRPMLDDVFEGGRFEVVSVGFVLALWSGSRALNVLVETITIMYGLGGHRGIVTTRLLSFFLYLMATARRRGDDPAGRRRPAAGRARGAAGAGPGHRAVLADRRGAVHLLPGHALPRLGAGPDVLAVQPRRVPR